MLKLQNYLDRYVVDRYTLRILYGKYSAEFLKTYETLRNHEKPHIIVLKKTANFKREAFPHFDSASFLEFEFLYQIREWCNYPLNFQKPGALSIQTSAADSVYDVIGDTKQRCPDGICTLEFSLIVEGAFYCETRTLGASCTLLRAYTADAKSTIFQNKLPLYVTKPESAKGRMLFNMTRAALVGAWPLVDRLRRVKNREPDPGDPAPLLTHSLIRREPNGTYMPTLRGNFVLYCASLGVSSIE